MGQFEFKARISAPYFAGIPPEIDEKWLKRMIGAKQKTYRGLKKAIKTQKDFKEKIGDPTKKTIASFINPEFVSRTGHTYRNIMDKTRDSLASAGKRYLRERKEVFETGKYEARLGLGQKEYARKWCEYLGPLKGYKAGHILGLSTMAIMALAGERKLVDYLRERNSHVDGQPMVIATTEKLNKFKRILDNQIVHWGSEIIKLGYEAQDIKRANEELNRLVNDYRRPEIAPFTSGGASHIDFIVVEISNPTKPGERIKQLGLEISVAVP
jgi:hypothetical protein